MSDDEILQALRAEGRPAGEGRFTVDPAAAWEKARGRQLDVGRPIPIQQAERVPRRRLPVTNAWWGLGIWSEEECDLCLAAVARRAAPARRATVTWVYQGVEIDEEELPLDPRVRVMASAGGLRLDLGSRPLRDRAYERRVRWLLDLVAELPWTRNQSK